MKKMNGSITDKDIRKLFFLQTTNEIVLNVLKNIKAEKGEITDEERDRLTDLYAFLLKEAGFEDEEIHTEWIEYFE